MLEKQGATARRLGGGPNCATGEGGLSTNLLFSGWIDAPIIDWFSLEVCGIRFIAVHCMALGRSKRPTADPICPPIRGYERVRQGVSLVARSNGGALLDTTFCGLMTTQNIGSG